MNKTKIVKFSIILFFALLLIHTFSFASGINMNLSNNSGSAGNTSNTANAIDNSANTDNTVLGSGTSNTENSASNTVGNGTQNVGTRKLYNSSYSSRTISRA